MSDTKANVSWVHSVSSFFVTDSTYRRVKKEVGYLLKVPNKYDLLPGQRYRLSKGHHHSWNAFVCDSMMVQGFMMSLKVVHRGMLKRVGLIHDTIIVK